MFYQFRQLEDCHHPDQCTCLAKRIRAKQWKNSKWNRFIEAGVPRSGQPTSPSDSRRALYCWGEGEYEHGDVIRRAIFLWIKSALAWRTLAIAATASRSV